jgi:capsular exopolysaccharide synthesis family protein
VAIQDSQRLRGFDIPAPLENAEVPPGDLRSALGVLLRHWKLICAFLLVALVGTYLVLIGMPRQYKSIAEILVVNPKIQSETTTRPLVGGPDASAMSTEIALIQSKSLALRVAKELDLDKEPRLVQPGVISHILAELGLSQMLESLGLSPHRQSDEASRRAAVLQPSSASGNANVPEQVSPALDTAAEELRQRIQVERLGLSYVLSISITTQDPALSQRIVDSVAKNFFAEELEARSDARGRAAGWLKKWVADLRDSLSQTEGEIEKIKAESGLSDVGLNGGGLSVNVTEQQMSELNKQLADVRAEVMEKKLRLEQARHLFESGGDIQAIPDVMGSSGITKLRQQQSELKWREQELRGKFGDRHVEVIAVRAQLASVNRQMNDEAQHIITNLQSTYDLALEHQQALEGHLRSLATSGSDYSSAYVKLRALQPAADAKRKLFEQALGDVDELSRRAAADDEGGRVIAPASQALPPNALRLVMIYVFVGAFGTAVGVLTAFLVEYLQSGFRTHAMAERTLGYPVLAMIPVVRQRFRRISGDFLVEALMRERRSQLSTSVETARIVLSFPYAAMMPKVILLTSAIAGEGKSAIARLLATSSAVSGRRTALVNCDLHHSSFSRQSGKERSGLAQVLEGETDVASVTVQDPATGLFIIPAGSAAKSPADLLSSQLMQDLVAQLRQQYEYVVIDASPLLPVVDTLTLAAVADKIVMIVEWGRTSRTSVFEALKTLRFAGYSIGGVVLNKVDYKRLASYGYGFGRDYIYGSRFRRATGKY